VTIDNSAESPVLRYRLLSEQWQQIDLLGKPVRVGRTGGGERERRWLITTLEHDGSRVVPFRGTETEAHERARAMGADRYSLVPRFGV
jgi:hypothetical protein